MTTVNKFTPYRALEEFKIACDIWMMCMDKAYREDAVRYCKETQRRIDGTAKKDQEKQRQAIHGGRYTAPEKKQEESKDQAPQDRSGVQTFSG